MLNLVIFGAPGSGKGTQSERLISEYGLLHISKISNDHIKNINDVLHVGDIVKVKILSIEQEKKRMALSMVDEIGRAHV